MDIANFENPEEALSAIEKLVRYIFRKAKENIWRRKKKLTEAENKLNYSVSHERKKGHALLAGS